MTRELIHQATRKDFRVDWFSGTGAGGQHRNKHQNCVRLVHIPTGLMTTGQEYRDRPANMRAAFKKMAKQLVDHWLGDLRRARFPGSDDVIRTYHAPDNRVLDHATGLQQPFDVVVGKPDLGDMIAARARLLRSH